MAISRPFLLAAPRSSSCSAPRCSPCRTPATTSDSDAAPAAVQSDPAPAPAQTPAQTAPADTLKSAFNLGQLESARLRRQGEPRLALAVAALRPVRRVRARRRQRRPRVRRPRPHLARQAARLRRLRLARRQGVLHPGRHRLARARRDLEPGGRRRSPTRAPPSSRLPACRSTPTPGCATSSPRAPSRWPASRPITSRPGRPQGRRQGPRCRPPRRTAPRFPTRAALARARQARRARRLGRLRRSHPAPAVSERWSSPAAGGWTLDVRLSDVNKPQAIEAPAHVRAGAPAARSAVRRGPRGRRQRDRSSAAR